MSEPEIEVNIEVAESEDLPLPSAESSDSAPAEIVPVIVEQAADTARLEVMVAALAGTIQEQGATIEELRAQLAVTNQVQTETVDAVVQTAAIAVAAEESAQVALEELEEQEEIAPVEEPPESKKHWFWR